MQSATRSSFATKTLLYGVVLGSVVLVSYYISGMVSHHFQALPQQGTNLTGHVDLQVSLNGNKPLSTQSKVGNNYLDSDDLYAASYLSVPQDHSLSVSTCLHLLKMFGPDASVDLHDGSKLRLLDILTNANLGAAVFKDPPVVRTRYGVRFPTGRFSENPQANETHRDQCLATFAEIGLPLSTPLSIGKQEFQLQDVLQDSVANFHLEQLELEWSTLAYVEYLAPVTRVWTNRYGESFSFDDLATELLNGRWWGQSCGGLHCLMALSSLYQANSEHHILTTKIQSKTDAKLRELVALSARQQQHDGSWHPGWTTPQVDTSGKLVALLPYRNQMITSVEYVLATGHANEWLYSLPQEFDVPEEVVAKATDWLLQALEKSTPSDRWNNFCPWSHAVVIINLPRPLKKRVVPHATTF